MSLAIPSLFARLKDVQLSVFWGLVWPQMLMLLCTIVINLTDTWVAGQISPGAQASVGMVFQVQLFLMIFAGALGAGGMASVSQSIGAGRWQRARRFAAFVLLASAVLAAFLSCLVYALAIPVLAVLQTPPELREEAYWMLRVILTGLPFFYVMQVGSTLFKAARQVIAPLVVMLLSCLINFAGDMCFGMGFLGFPALGLKGVIWSTVAANAASGALTYAVLRHGGLLPRKLLPDMRWMRCAARYLCKVALPACCNGLMWQTGYLVLFAITASLPGGVEALAGFTAGNRIEAILYMPATAFMVTASILVGNYLGAGDKETARHTGTALFLLSALSMSAVAGLMWPFIGDIARHFSPEQAVQVQIRHYLFFNVLAVPFTVSGLVLHGVMNGAGATVYSLLANVIGFWIVRLPLAWWLSHFLYGDAYGVYMAMFLSMVVQTSVITWIFFRWDWAAFALHAPRSR